LTSSGDKGLGCTIAEGAFGIFGIWYCG